MGAWRAVLAARAEREEHTQTGRRVGSDTLASGPDPRQRDNAGEPPLGQEVTKTSLRGKHVREHDGDVFLYESSGASDGCPDV